MTHTAMAAMIQGCDNLINAVGNIADGPSFTALVDRIACAAEMVPTLPTAWFMAGAALLDMNASGLNGYDIPLIPKKYRLHGENHARLTRSSLDWRLCCPGPMVDEPAIGLEKMRVSIDRLPVSPPGWTVWAPAILSLLYFTKNIEKITVPYADVAELILSNLLPGGGDHGAA